MMVNNNTGTAKDAEHYIKSALQPIQVMQKLMTPEQFRGFLIGNVIKYRMRDGLKENTDDKNKVRQYAYWLSLTKRPHPEPINPVKDSVPADFSYGGITLC